MPYPCVEGKLSALFVCFFNRAHNPAILNIWADSARRDERKMNNVHRGTRVTGVGMGGRIGLERGLVSTIDHNERRMLQILMVKQLSMVVMMVMEGQLLCPRRCHIVRRGRGATTSSSSSNNTNNDSNGDSNSHLVVASKQTCMTEG